MSSLVCWNCGAGLDDIPRPISRHASCPACFNELHCCRLCRHFDPGASMTCHEDRADPPLQKENANFCDYFSPRFDAFEDTTADKSAAARNHLDDLFDQQPDEAQHQEAQAADDAGPAQPHPQTSAGGDAELSKEALARKKLDDLFK